MKVLVTGGTGFVRRAVRRALQGCNHKVTLALRGAATAPVGDREHVTVVGEIDRFTDWGDTLEGVDVVVHLAARAHQIKDAATDPRGAFLEVNYEGTKRLAEQAAGRVRRFVFLSTIGVHGSASGGQALDETSPIAPETPYAESKARAEKCILDIATSGGFEAVVLRAPLIYGRDAPGNLARLAGAVRRGVPLPLASVRNRRSLIGVNHLAKVVLAAVDAERVDNKPYVVADREVVSTPEIVRALAIGLGKSAKLLPVPVTMLKLSGAMIGRRATVEQLIGSLTVDASAFRNTFGNMQPCSTVDGLIDAARTSMSVNG